jgi:hypothetical protein
MAASGGAELIARDVASQTITYARLKAGASIVVCNDGARPARVVRASLLDFTLLQQGGTVAPRVVLTVTPPPRPLAPGACRPVKIRLQTGATLDAGTYAGTLVVTSTAGVVRLPLTLSGPSGAVGVEPALGPGSTIELRAMRDGPWSGDAHLEGDGIVYVRVTGPGASPQLPKAGQLMGSVLKGEDLGQVYRAEEQPTRDPADHDLWKVPVRVKRLNHVGEYRGKLDLTGSGAGAGASVTVTVSDTAWCAVAAVALGALLAFLAQLWLRNWRVALRWRRRLRRLRAAYRDVPPIRFGPPGAIRHVKGPTSSSTRAYADKLNATVREGTSWYAFFDTQSDVYRGVVSSLSDAERDAACLASRLSDGLRSSLEGLAHQVDAVLCRMRQMTPADDVPEGIVRAGKLLNVEQLEVGGATKLADAARRQTALLGHWLELYERVLGLELLEGAVAASLPEKSNGSKAATVGLWLRDRATLMRARADLNQAERDLFAAKDANELQHSGVEARLDRADDALELLVERRKVRLEAQAPCRHTARLVPPLPICAEDASGGQSAADTPNNLVDLLNAPDGAEVQAAQPPRLVDQLRSLGDLLVLAFSFAVGVVLVLGLVFYGKTFGSTEDYFTAIATGATSQLLLSPVLERLDQMRQADRDTLMVTAPKAADLTGLDA